MTKQQIAEAEFERRKKLWEDQLRINHNRRQYRKVKLFQWFTLIGVLAIVCCIIAAFILLFKWAC